MVTGDKSKFAIESGITKAYDRLSFRALGFFVIHIGNMHYGVHEPDATMLACSFDKVQERIAKRGKHTAFFANEPDAGKIAEAYRNAIFADNRESERFFGITQPEFSALFRSNSLVWCPDGDEAFDDGSYVLQFDVENRVRLIGFKSYKAGYHYDPATLRDVWLDIEEFYRVLGEWREAFEAEWKAASKISEYEDGAEVSN